MTSHFALVCYVILYIFAISGLCTFIEFANKPIWQYIAAVFVMVACIGSLFLGIVLGGGLLEHSIIAQ